MNSFQRNVSLNNLTICQLRFVFLFVIVLVPRIVRNARDENDTVICLKKLHAYRHTVSKQRDLFNREL